MQAVKLLQWLALKLGDWWFHGDAPSPKTSALKAKSSWKKRRIEEYRREIARMKELRRGK